MSRTPARTVVALALCGTGLTVGYLLLITRPLRLDQVAPSRETDLAIQLGAGWWALASFIATMTVLGLLYLLALRLAARITTGAAGLALLLTVLQAAVLLPAHPFDSADALHYVASARLFTVHGLNPLTTPPAAVPDDPVVALAGWQQTPSPYGPLWSLITAVPRPILGDDAGPVAELLAIKVIAALALTATAAVTGDAVSHLRPGRQTLAIVLVGWCPLLLLHGAGDGHNDVVMLLGLAFALCAVTRDRPVAAGAALAMAAMIKFIPLALFPALLIWLWRSDRRHRRREALLIAALPAVIAVLLYAPFWQGTATLAAGLDEGRYLTTSLHAAVVPLLLPLMSRDHADAALIAAGRAVFVVLALRTAWRVRPGALGVSRAWTVTMLWYLVAGAAWLMPWYVLWALIPAVPGFAGTRPSRLVVALVVGGLLQPAAPDYLARIAGNPDAWQPVHGIATALLFGPAAVLLAWESWSRRCKGQRGLASCDTVAAMAARRRDGDDDGTGPSDGSGGGDHLHRSGTGAGPRVHGEPGQG